jgi:hypothetical protein
MSLQVDGGYSDGLLLRSLLTEVLSATRNTRNRRILFQVLFHAALLVCE